MPSSVVASVTYEEKSSKLRITYSSGNIYDYKDVPAEVYHKMIKSFSKGEFLNKEIKPYYKFERIT